MSHMDSDQLRPPVGIAIDLIIEKISGAVYSLNFPIKKGKPLKGSRRIVTELEILSGILKGLRAQGHESDIPLDIQSTIERAIGQCERDVEKLSDKINSAGYMPLAKLAWMVESTSSRVLVLRKHIGAFTEVWEKTEQFQSDALKRKVSDLAKERDENIRTEAYRIRVLDWLYPEPFDKIHVQIRNRRQPGTGEWILNTPEFLEWENLDDKLLWGYGILGSGKTFLSSRVIDHLLERRVMENYGVAYIYFNPAEQNQRDPNKVFSSLVKQLVCQIPQMPREIEVLYEKLNSQQRRPTLDDLCYAIVALRKLFRRIFIVCDALDECREDIRRMDLLPLFRQLYEADVNLFIISREHPQDIRLFHSMNSALKIRLSASEGDIIRYINQKISENARASRFIEQAQCRDEIISCLLHHAQGMFLLVHFHLKYICQQVTSRHVLAELERIRSSTSLDRPLDPAYDIAMATVQSQTKNCVDLALRILMWLVKARRVLTVKDIQMAISIEPNRYRLDEMDLSEATTLLDVCAGLVTIDESNNTIRIAHPTMQEYLLRNSIITQNAGFQLAMACVTFLSYDLFTEGACNSDSSLHARYRSYPFLDYVAKHLAIHLKDCAEDLTTQLVLKFLKEPGSIESYLQAAHTSPTQAEKDSGIFYSKDDYDAYPKGQNSLHVAATLGHRSVVWLLLEEIDIEAVDKRGQTAIHIASAEGHVEVVQLLLQKGANPFAADNDGITALKLAENKGQESLVRSMLAKRSNFSNADTSESYESAILTPPENYNTPNSDNDGGSKPARANLSSKLDRYKLVTAIYEDHVIHTVYKTDLAARQRKVSVEEKWTRKREIGAGGFGVVLLEEEQGGKLRAVKKMPLVRNFDYSRELNTLAKLTDHQHLFVQFFGWFQDPHFLYIAMEYVEYGDLSQYIKDGSARSKARDITSQLLEGLMVLHERQICHRDLKPQNVLVACKDPIWVKIADFGVSKREKDANLHTQLGTGGYLAPELLGLLPRRFGTGRSYTNAVDFWALGCLVHETLTFQIPFVEAEFQIGCSDISFLTEESIEPQVDMKLLSEYCNSTVEFPAGPLRDSKVSEEGIRFVKRLLDPDPSSRMSPAEGLESPWLLEKEI